MLAATQRRCETVWRDWGHCVGDWYTALLQLGRKHTTVNMYTDTHRHRHTHRHRRTHTDAQAQNVSQRPHTQIENLQTNLFMQVHDHGSLLLLRRMMLLLMKMVMVVVSSRVQ